MYSIDLRVYKQNMRDKARKRRGEMTAQLKSQMDEAILTNVVRLRQYARCHTVLVYVSISGEIDTLGIIRRCLADGKRVAVPRCVTGTRDMVFHYISDLNELSPGAFGVPEPQEDMPQVDPQNGEGMLMLLPALTADHFGYRLGYGKGYYDRYMSKFGGCSAVLCYDEDVVRRLTHGKFDVPSQVLVTDKYIRTIKREGQVRKFGRE